MKADGSFHIWCVAPLSTIHCDVIFVGGETKWRGLTLWFPALVIVAKMATNMDMVCFCCQNGHKISFASNIY